MRSFSMWIKIPVIFRNIEVSKFKTMAQKNITTFLFTAFFCLGSTILPFPGFAADYDQTPVPLKAYDVLALRSIKSAHYKINSQVTNDGLMNLFEIESSFLTIKAYGNDMALERGREMEAIAAIRKIKKTDAYFEGLGKAAMSPLHASKKLLTSPIQTLGDLASGVNQVFKNLFSSIKNLGKDKKSEEDGMIKELLGFNNVKRRLAAELNVDPYSTNELLQKELSDLAWTSFAGGGTIDVALAAASGGTATLAITALRSGDQVAEMVREKSPTTLQVINTERLEKMKVKEDTIEPFLFHKHCSPRHQTLLVDSLYRLGKAVKGRDKYFQAASKSDSESDCRFYQKTAELILGYHKNLARVKRILHNKGFIFFQDARGRVILPAMADYVSWTQEVASMVKAFPSTNKEKVFCITGRVSERTELELQERNIEVKTSGTGLFARKK